MADFGSPALGSPGTPSRHEKSLGLLTTKFVSLLQEAKDGVLDLKVVSAKRNPGLLAREIGDFMFGCPSLCFPMHFAFTFCEVMFTLLSFRPPIHSLFVKSDEFMILLMFSKE